MNKLKKIMLCIMMVQTYCVINASSIVESASKGIPETKAILKSISEEKSELLKELKEEKASLEIAKSSALKNTISDLEEYKNKRTAVEQELEKDPEDEFLVKKLSLLTANHDVLRDIQRIWEGLMKKISDHVTLLEKYLRDTELREYAKEVKVSAGPYFFEDLEDAHQKMTSQQRFVEQLKRRKESALKEQKSLMLAAEKAAEEYKEKKAKQEDFSKTPTEGKSSHVPFSLSTQQRAELLALETNLYKLKNEVAQLQLKEKRQEVSLIDDELFIENIHLDILSDFQQKVKSSITVTPEQIATAFQELEKKKQVFSHLKAKYTDEINKLHKMSEEESHKLMPLSVRFGIQLGNELNTWAVDPKKTFESYKGIAMVGALNAHVQLLDEREIYFEALISSEQEKINYVEEIARVKETYYKITSRKFLSEDEIGQEIKKYTARLASTDAMLKSYKTKKEETETSLSKLQNEVLENLKKRKADTQKQKDTVFKTKIAEYGMILSAIDKAEEDVLLRIDALNSIGKSYAEIISILDKVYGHTKFILGELESITIWYRPEYAISWAGIQSIGSDIKMFFVDVRMYISQFDVGILTQKTKDLFRKPLQLILFLLGTVCFWGCLLFVRRYTSFVMTVLFVASEQYKRMRVLLLLLAMVVGFVGRYTLSLGLWCMMFAFVHYYLAADPYMLILFYLISIPYLLYLAYEFFNFMFAFNASNKYFLINQESQWRFNLIFSFLIYTTIIFMFFRQAFMLVKFSKSELPIILLACNFIVLQISLILLISKEQTLNLIPTRYDVAQSLYKIIDRYYYILVLFIISIIVMSNPYVGYGRLVLYLISGLFWSLILLKLLHWGHLLIKRGASLIFFSSEEEVVRERFRYAKTCFGVAIIGSFLLSGIIGIIVGAKIWGWPITLSDVLKWLHQPIFGIGKGTSSPLTSITILTILIFILAGFLISFAFNRFVLDKIFELMLVDAGVQNAIANLSRYVFVATAVLLGFQTVGYGGLITYMYLLVLGVGYLVQNPLHDLIAYFIILLQRPIKVGDYIQVDSEVMGVVRKITPKSVTLRRKNSTTIVVPNTQIINRPITNWNYTRNFIAFNDIMLRVGYKEDPAKVKDILFSAVDSHLKILKNPKPVIRLDDFTQDGFQFLVRGFLSSSYTLEQWDIASDVRLTIIKMLRENGIEIAMPVRIMLKKDDERDYQQKMMQ